jgi:ABC-type multidrug transport system ATPase subunit
VNIVLEKTGKKFYREWIFRNLDLSLESADTLAILGPNGSGKSTLLQVISGSMIPTEGSIRYFENAKPIEAEEVFRHVSFSAPYLELIEEFTLTEIIQFHFRFKPAVDNLSMKDIISVTGLENQKEKIFKYFSSGMKQRVKLTLALLSDVKMILLDEPCSNLDKEAIKWYRQLIEQYAKRKLIIVCSNNQPEEFDFCRNQIQMTDWKPGKT